MELSKEKIDFLRKKIEKQNSVFSDKRYLDTLFLPSKIIGREDQTEQLLQYIMSLKDGFLVPFISVYGRSGSGKSTVVKFVCQSLSDVISTAFVNLRKSKTVFGCANSILSELGAANLKSAEGLNKAIECIEKRTNQILEAEKKNFFILVLDEYDVIFSDNRGKPSDFVYKLLTLEENLREKERWLCIISISNNALSEYSLDDRVKSRMGNAEVFFTPYSEKAVLQILRNRAKKAFANKVPDVVLEHCARLSSDDHGDARRALDLLRTSGEISDGKKITKDDVEKAQQRLQKDRVSVLVSNSSYHLRVVIGAICANTLDSGNAWNPTSAIYDKYCSMIVEGKKPLSYRRIVDLLVEVQNSGLVISRTLSKGRHGYGTEYKLQISPDIVGPTVSEEWWEKLVDNKKVSDEIHELRKGLSSSRKSYGFGLDRWQRVQNLHDKMEKME